MPKFSLRRKFKTARTIFAAFYVFIFASSMILQPFSASVAQAVIVPDFSIGDIEVSSASSSLDGGLFLGSPNYIATWILLSAPIIGTGADGCEYTMDGGLSWNLADCNGTSIFKQIDSGIFEGTSYTFQFRAKGSVSGLVYSNILTAVGDIKNPIVSLTYPDSGAGVGVEESFDYSPVEKGSGLDRCEFYWNYPSGGGLFLEQTQYAPISGNIGQFNVSGLNITGNYEWNVICYDNVGWNSGWSETPNRSFVVGGNDSDGDGVVDGDDNCPDYNPNQADFDNDDIGDECDNDDDGDNVFDSVDVLPFDQNVCGDVDGDTCDDCSSGALDTYNDGADNDADGICNMSDFDNDNDNVSDVADNCVADYNPDQIDSDNDGLGDVCDETPNGEVAETVLAGWNFNDEDRVADEGMTENSSKEIQVIGASGYAYPSGYDSSFAVSADHWNLSGPEDLKYWQAEFSTKGYGEIAVSFRQRSSGTGPKSFNAQYKVGSGEWAYVSAINLSSNEWSSLEKINLPEDAFNKDSVSVRWLATDLSAAAPGTNRIDDIVVSGAILSGPDWTEIFTAIRDALMAVGIENNIDTCADMPTACSGLYFEKVDFGRIYFPGDLDLTDEITVETLQSLAGGGINFANREIKFDAQADDAFKTLGGVLEMYDLDFEVTPDINVDGTPATEDDVEDIDYNSEEGILTFTAKHFSTFTVSDKMPIFPYNYVVGNGANVDAAVDSAGNLHAVYERNGGVYYVKNRGAEELVGIGSLPAISLGIDGSIYTAFVSGGLVKMNYKSGDSWIDNGFFVGSSVSSFDFDVDGLGNIHIVYSRPSGENYDDIIYANNIGGVFAESTLCHGYYWSGFGGTYCGHPVSMKIDSSGYYHIAYISGWRDSTPKYSTQNMVYATNGEGSGSGSPGFNWNSTPVSSFKNGIGIDSFGRAYVVYASGGTIYNGLIEDGIWTQTIINSGSDSSVAISGLGMGVAYNNSGIKYKEDNGSGLSDEVSVDVGTNPVAVLFGADRFVYYVDGDDMIHLASSKAFYSKPIISGVTEGGLYNNDVTVSWDNGDGLLNGLSMDSGAVISESNDYVLTVTNSEGQSSTVNFVIDKINPDLSFVFPTPDDGAVAGPNDLVFKVDADEELSFGQLEFDDYIHDCEVDEDQGMYVECSVSGVSEGTYSYSILAKDLAGNASIIRRTVVIDASGPRIISAEATAWNQIEIVFGESLQNNTIHAPSVTDFEVVRAMEGASVSIFDVSYEDASKTVTLSLSENLNQSDSPLVRIDSLEPTTVADIFGNITYRSAWVEVEDGIAPTAVISYSPIGPTNGNVTATLNPSEDVRVSNNDGFNYIFSENGEFTFEFVDTAGNTGSAKAEVSSIDKTAPEGYVFSPQEGATIAGVVNVVAEVEDGRNGSGVAKVEFFHSSIAGVKIGEDSTAPFDIDWDTKDSRVGVEDGEHALYLLITDNAGNSIFSERVYVNVFNDFPGSVNNPAPLSTCAELQNVRGDYHYYLVNDIDCSGFSFRAIANYNAVFDGRGYKIKNLSITAPNSNWGLFSYLESEAVIKNLGIENINIANGDSYTGGIAGWNMGLIQDCYVTGSIIANYQEVGGIVGSNQGNVERCYVDIDLRGGGYTGGITGSNKYGKVNNCYSKGSVNGASNSGGISGLNAYNGASVINSYSIAEVSGGTGALLGWNYDGGIITDSYWSIELSRTENMCVDGCGNQNEKTPEEMKVMETYAGWNFENIWAIDAEKNEGYPYFGWQTFIELDTTKPVITLIGESTVNLTAGDDYKDAGATAMDDVDGDITESISANNPVDPDVAGTYTIIYNVEDSSGNKADQVSRTVIVAARQSSGGGGFSGGSLIFYPTNYSVKINNGAVSTGNKNVRLALLATNASKIAISNDPNFAGISWEAYTIEKDWILSEGEGQKTVYVRFSSPSGGTVMATDTIDFIVSNDENEITQGEVLGEQRFADGALIRAIGEFDVYIVKYIGDKQFKRLILSPEVFNSYSHLKWEDVLDVEKSVVDSFTTSDLVRAVGDAKVYKIYPNGDAGEKRWIKTAEIFVSMGLDWDAVYEINSAELDSYVNGLPIE